MLDGIEVRVCTALVGSKKAVRVGDGPIYVGPAMWDLISHAEGEELQKLLATIQLVSLPAFDPFTMPMTTTPEW